MTGFLRFYIHVYVDGQLIISTAYERDQHISNRNKLASSSIPQLDMCAQGHLNAQIMCHTHEGRFLATPIRKPTLTRMPKVAHLTTAICFARTLPTVSARMSGQAVSRPTQTPPDWKITLCNQPNSVSPDARPALTVTNNPTCQHRRSHALVHGRWIPFCLEDDDAKKIDNLPAVAVSQNVYTETAVAGPTLAINKDPTCRHRRSHALVQGRWVPFCVRCGDAKKRDDLPAVTPSEVAIAKTTIGVGARPVLQTMQGFPFDLRRSRVEAGRLME
ncbi:hypothetical protein Q7P35_010488 [Cladosporium inversicolor]